LQHTTLFFIIFNSKERFSNINDKVNQSTISIQSNKHGQSTRVKGYFIKHPKNYKGKIHQSQRSIQSKGFTVKTEVPLFFCHHQLHDIRLPSSTMSSNVEDFEEKIASLLAFHINQITVCDVKSFPY
jgi:hypothetical protein